MIYSAYNSIINDCYVVELLLYYYCLVIYSSLLYYLFLNTKLLKAEFHSIY